MVSEPQSSNEQLVPSVSAFQKKKQNPIQSTSPQIFLFQKTDHKYQSLPSKSVKPLLPNQNPSLHAFPRAAYSFRKSRSLHCVAETTKFQIYCTQPPINKKETTNQQIGGRSTHRHKNKADPMMNAPPRASQIPAFLFTCFQFHTRATRLNQSCLTPGLTRGSLDPIRGATAYC